MARILEILQDSAQLRLDIKTVKLQVTDFLQEFTSELKKTNIANNNNNNNNIDADFVVRSADLELLDSEVALSPIKSGRDLVAKHLDDIAVGRLVSTGDCGVGWKLRRLGADGSSTGELVVERAMQRACAAGCVRRPRSKPTASAGRRAVDGAESRAVGTADRRRPATPHANVDEFRRRRINKFPSLLDSEDKENVAALFPLTSVVSQFQFDRFPPLSSPPTVVKQERKSTTAMPAHPTACSSPLEVAPLPVPSTNVPDNDTSSSGIAKTLSFDVDDPTTESPASLNNVSAISRKSDNAVEPVVAPGCPVRSTSSTTSLNGAFCSSFSANEAAFCSTFNYPLHSTVIDSLMFDVSLLEGSCRSSTAAPDAADGDPAAATDALSSTPNAPSVFNRVATTEGGDFTARQRTCKRSNGLTDLLCREHGLHPRFDNDRPCIFVDRRDRQQPKKQRRLDARGVTANADSFILLSDGDVESTAAAASEQDRLPSSSTAIDWDEMNNEDSAAEASGNVRMRRQMGQTRLYANSSNNSSCRQSDVGVLKTFAELCREEDNDTNDVADFSRSTVLGCGCPAARRCPAVLVAESKSSFKSRLRPGGCGGILFPVPSRTVPRVVENSELLNGTARTGSSWYSSSTAASNRRVTLHCVGGGVRDVTVPENAAERQSFASSSTTSRHQHNRQTAPLSRHRDLYTCRSRPAEERQHRRAEWNEVDRFGATSSAAGDIKSTGGCPYCTAASGYRAVAGAAASETGAASSLRHGQRATSATDVDAAAALAYRRRKKELVRKLRRFSNAFYGNAGELRLTTFGHV